MNFVDLLVFALRGGSASTKRLFVFYLAGKASSMLLGQVALVTTLVVIFTQIARLELNQVISRQLLALSDSERLRMLRSQAKTAVAA